MRSRILPKALSTAICLLLLGAWISQAADAPTPQETLGTALGKWIEFAEPTAGTAPRTLSVTLRVAEADGLGKDLVGRTVPLSFQAPDRLRVQVEIEGRILELGRRGQELWLYAPGSHLALTGSSEVPRFAATPNVLDGTQLPPFRLPLPKEQLILLPLLLQLEACPDQDVNGTHCAVLKGQPQAQAAQAFKLPVVRFKLWLRESDAWPARLAISDAADKRLVIDFDNLRLADPAADDFWTLKPDASDHVETVALSHLVRFIPAALSLLHQDLPTLGPATGECQVVATEGSGRLEIRDGTRVLFLKGTPEEMGRQHGILMRRQVRDLVDKILYGIGVGSSFEKGRWFFGEIEEAQRRISPFMDERYLREMDSMALAANLEPQEVRLANFFPELFHCSGFALFGSATTDGRLYHGRILDYLRGVGLEANAVVIIHQPDYGHAWANVSYGGFVGSVTAMNEVHISMGEMGGRGEGNWDGKPMAELVREVMEKANTLEEAVEILRRGPRTCEYYYVLADGKSNQAVGLACTPTTFEVIHPGEAHPRLPHSIKDAVLMSAGDRYEHLAERVQDQYGRIDAQAALGLMKRPVAMTSNIHSVLFEPETLDFWVANADAEHPASHCRFTHYNLGELLKSSAQSPADH